MVDWIERRRGRRNASNRDIPILVDAFTELAFLQRKAVFNCS
ncbi:hypothetical protein ANCCAN_07179 [Ancylostoma caninum]|uniref:Uncharacterized protein n=1 Tax=Ancylostoma caninum TaxID=29170 RepID=A0A368GUT5_ANCCA|nr:hypothetical protein ANCCAN_07179 [Ancylostoma caninum]